MSDERLRELERRAAMGANDDGARLLIERLRAGQLPLERLQLLAHLGLPSAVAALGDDLLCACGHRRSAHTRSYPPADVQEPHSTTACNECSPCSAFDTTDIDTGDLEWWAGQLPNWGREVCVRIALAVSRVALKHWIASSDGPKKDCPHCDGGQVYCSRCSSYGCRGPCDRCDGHGKQPDDNPPAAQALRAAQDWLDIPAEEEERAAMQASAGAGREWASLTAMLCYRNMKEETIVDVIRAALEDAPQAEVRAAIKGTIEGFLA